MCGGLWDLRARDWAVTWKVEACECMCELCAQENVSIDAAVCVAESKG